MIIPLLVIILGLTLIIVFQWLKLYCHKKQQSEFLHRLNTELQIIISMDTFIENTFYEGSKFNKRLDRICEHVMTIKNYEAMLKSCKFLNNGGNKNDGT